MSYNLAFFSVNPEICNQINNSAEIYREVRFLTDEETCYFYIAINQSNPNLCNNIRTGDLKTSCLAYATKNWNLCYNLSIGADQCLSKKFTYFVLIPNNLTFSGS